MRILNLFWKRCDGVTAVEFGLAAPLLAFVLLGIETGWTTVTQIADMHRGLRAGASYVLKGGTDLQATKEAALSSWTNRPSGSSLDVVQKCTCAGATADCSSVCADLTDPQKTIVITGTTSVSASLVRVMSPMRVSVTKQEVVRVQ